MKEAQRVVPYIKHSIVRISHSKAAHIFSLHRVTNGRVMRGDNKELVLGKQKQQNDTNQRIFSICNQGLEGVKLRLSQKKTRKAIRMMEDCLPCCCGQKARAIPISHLCF